MLEQLFILDTGFCQHPEFSVIRGGKLGMARFPSTVVVMHHRQHGVILFDTGYAPRFKTATSRGLPKLYGMTTPVHSSSEQTAAAQLRAFGIDPAAVQHVILSHFHADHIAGLMDFPNAKIHYRDDAYDHLKDLGPFARLLRGFLPTLLPADFLRRSVPVSVHQKRLKILAYAPFTDGYDLFGDGSIIAVDLVGHAPGHIGMIARTASETYFFVADAAWLTRNIEANIMPSAITRLIIADFSAYERTLGELHALAKTAPNLHLIPCHCPAATTPLIKARGTPARAQAGS